MLGFFINNQDYYGKVALAMNVVNCIKSKLYAKLRSDYEV